MARFETAANVGIVLLCIAVCGDLTYRYMLRPVQPLRVAAGQAVPPSVRAQEYRPGDTLVGLPDVDFRRASRTLLLVVRSTCHYCRASTPFYRQLASSKSRIEGLRIVGVCTESKEACATFLRQEKLELDDIMAVRPGGLRIRGTPTLVLVDAQARVVKLWTGQLQDAKQREVLRVLEGRS